MVAVIHFIFTSQHNRMFSFKIRDRQTAVLIRSLSADCVGIASDGVLGVAEWVLTVSWSGRGTFM